MEEIYLGPRSWGSLVSRVQAAVKTEGTLACAQTKNTATPLGVLKHHKTQRGETNV